MVKIGRSVYGFGCVIYIQDDSIDEIHTILHPSIYLYKAYVGKIRNPRDITSTDSEVNLIELSGRSRADWMYFNNSEIGKIELGGRSQAWMDFHSSKAGEIKLSDNSKAYSINLINSKADLIESYDNSEFSLYLKGNSKLEKLLSSQNSKINIYVESEARIEDFEGDIQLLRRSQIEGEIPKKLEQIIGK
ncbi:MAG: hypothetical protein DRP10_01755 [Candidatus Aenigmatarchaeota archaeon]|nr:MAG: hypothetical protein DRP10_01755 [Candidatus Aenigmarchaeota archaeon]